MKEFSLLLATQWGDKNKVIKLHKSGVSLKGEVGKMTPLMHASICRCSGMFGIFDYIFEHIATEGIDVNGKEERGRTALHIACDNGGTYQCI